MPREVLLPPDAIPIIEEAGRILRETSPVEEFELQGFVIALDRPAGAEVGTVTVLGFVEEAPRRIRIQLRDPDYHIAVQAHDQRLPIFCVGELLREGRSFVLNQPRQLRIGQQEEA